MDLGVPCEDIVKRQLPSSQGEWPQNDHLCDTLILEF
jgi:hypothetical protein